MAHFWAFTGGTGRVAFLALEFGSNVIANGRTGIHTGSL